MSEPAITLTLFPTSLTLSLNVSQSIIMTITSINYIGTVGVGMWGSSGPSNFDMAFSQSQISLKAGESQSVTAYITHVGGAYGENNIGLTVFDITDLSISASAGLTVTTISMPQYLEFYICSEPSVTIPNFDDVAGVGAVPKIMRDTNINAVFGLNVSADYVVPIDISSLNYVETITSPEGILLDITVNYNALSRYITQYFLSIENGIIPSSLPLPYNTPPLGNLTSDNNWNNIHCTLNLTIPKDIPLGVYDITYANKPIYDSFLSSGSANVPTQLEVVSFSQQTDLTPILAIGGLAIVFLFLLR